MQRRTLIAVLCAATVGGTSGSLAALHLAQRRRGSAGATMATAGSEARPAAAAGSSAAMGSAAPAAAGAAASHDESAILTVQMKRVLERFSLWARSHADSPCPDLISLGVPTMDPWGHDLVLTCTDQPASQRIGVMSAGPDGHFGTDDDITSWSMGPAITNLVRGARWQPLAAVAPVAPTDLAPARTPSHRPPRSRVPAPSRAPTTTSPPSATSPPPAPASAPPSSPPASPDSDDIPSRRSPR